MKTQDSESLVCSWTVGEPLAKPSGNIAKALVKGSAAFTSAESALRAAVDEFNQTLSHYGHGIGFRTLQVVEG
jgi:hypothetical protein